MHQLPLLPTANSAPEPSKALTNRSPSRQDNGFGDEMDRAQSAVSRADSQDKRENRVQRSDSGDRVSGNQSVNEGKQSPASNNENRAESSGSSVPQKAAESDLAQEKGRENQDRSSDTIDASSSELTSESDGPDRLAHASSSNGETASNINLFSGKPFNFFDLGNASSGTKDSSGLFSSELDGFGSLRSSQNSGGGMQAPGGLHGVTQGIESFSSNGSYAGTGGAPAAGGMDSKIPGSNSNAAGLVDGSGSSNALSNSAMASKQGALSPGASTSSESAVDRATASSGIANPFAGELAGKQQAANNALSSEASGSAKTDTPEGLLDTSSVGRQNSLLQNAVAGASASDGTGQQYGSELDSSVKAHFDALRSAAADADVSVDIKVDSTPARGIDSIGDKGSLNQISRPYVSSLPLPVDSAEWAEQLGQKLAWLGARNIQTAELHLNPADLGPIDVRIQIGSDQSSINFSSQNATVRELLEANIHRLRDMIAEQNQGQQQASNDRGGSSDQSGSESEQTGQAMAGFSDDSSVDAEELGPRTTTASNVSSDSVVDAYI